MIFFRYLFNLFKLLMILILTVLGLLWLPYIETKYYNFPEPKQFSGQQIFNPYSSMDSNSWVKANFQIQSYAWKGITSGRMNTNDRIDSIYQLLDYDIIATSDYMKINRHRENYPSYVPVYEHGYGIFKNHQVCIGAKKVDWFDFFFYQTINHKQQVLNKIRANNELVFIAHPKLRKGYAPDDFKYLTNYDGIEVLNNYRVSLEHWDAALSSGHYVTILSDDDAHNINNPDEIGHYCTFINVTELNKENIISSLKSGNAFGAEIYRERGDSYQIKKEKLKEIATIKSVRLVDDTIRIMVDKMASEIRFIGQDGKIVKIASETLSADYQIQESDSYIRIEIFFPNGNKFYLNPFIRHDGDMQLPQVESVKWLNTWLYRIVAFLIFISMGYFIFRIARSIQFKTRT